jgi:hypothetical protein
MRDGRNVIRDRGYGRRDRLTRDGETTLKLIKEMGWGVVVLLGALCMGLLITACASYYRVTDPVSGRIYYTEKVERESGGAASFTDAASDSKITIQNSEVKELSSKEYETALAAAKAKPATAPPAAPAPGPPAATAPAAPAPPVEETK